MRNERSAGRAEWRDEDGIEDQYIWQQIIQKRVQCTEQERKKRMNFLLILALKYALFTAAMFLTGMVMCYFFDGETDRLKNE